MLVIQDTSTSTNDDMECDDDDATSPPLPPDRQDHSTSKSSESTTPMEDEKPKVEEVDETEVDETKVQPTGQSSSDKEEEDEATFISWDASCGKLIFDLDHMLKSLQIQPELLKFLVSSYEQFRYEPKGLHENHCRVSSVVVWLDLDD